MLTLSIIILNYRDVDTTIACLSSLSELVLSSNEYEVIVVDNGSEDGSGMAIKEKFHSWGKKFKIIELAENLGVAGGRNIGLKNVSQSRYTMFLDNDTIVSKKAMEDLIFFMDGHPDVGIAGPCLRSFDGMIQRSFKNFPGIREKFMNVIFKRDVKNVEIDRDIIFPCYVIGACQIFRSELIDKIGVLDEKIFFGPEDADFCIRIRKSGLKVAYIPNIDIIHHWQRTSRKNPFSATSRRHLFGLFYFYNKWNRWL